MSQNIEPGDFLVCQLESGYAILRVLAIDIGGGERAWHIATYDQFFIDVESAEAFLKSQLPKPSVSHIALTDRAFESTQTAKIAHAPISSDENLLVNEWRSDPNNEVSDRSVRLMLGLR